MNWSSQYGAINGTDAKAAFESTMLFKSTDPVSVWKAWNSSTLTQKWINTPASNYGVILWASNEHTDGQALQFNSSEAASNKPYLEVIYSSQAKTVYFLKKLLSTWAACHVC
ncbi:MAG: DNRLRE domain-containing protein [bacterium]